MYCEVRTPATWSRMLIAPARSFTSLGDSTLGSGEIIAMVNGFHTSASGVWFCLRKSLTLAVKANRSGVVGSRVRAKEAKFCVFESAIYKQALVQQCGRVTHQVNPRSDQVELGNFDTSLKRNVLPHLDCLFREMDSLPPGGTFTRSSPLPCKCSDREELAGRTDIEPVPSLLCLQ